MRFGAAQRTIGISYRLKAGEARDAEHLKLRLECRPPVGAMIEVDVVNLTAIKPGRAIGLRHEGPVRFARPALFENFILCPAAIFVAQPSVVFSKD